MDELTFVSLLFIAAGILEIIIGTPLLFEKIKQNYFYGLRTKKTLNNEKVWYNANKFFGREAIFDGVLLTIVSFFVFIYRYDFGVNFVTIIGIMFLIVPLFISIARSYYFLRNL